MAFIETLIFIVSSVAAPVAAVLLDVVFVPVPVVALTFAVLFDVVFVPVPVVALTFAVPLAAAFVPVLVSVPVAAVPLGAVFVPVLVSAPVAAAPFAVVFVLVLVVDPIVAVPLAGAQIPLVGSMSSCFPSYTSLVQVLLKPSDGVAGLDIFLRVSGIVIQAVNIIAQNPPDSLSNFLTLKSNAIYHLQSAAKIFEL